MVGILNEPWSDNVYRIIIIIIIIIPNIIIIIPDYFYLDPWLITSSDLDSITIIF